MKNLKTSPIPLGTFLALLGMMIFQKSSLNILTWSMYIVGILFWFYAGIIMPNKRRRIKVRGKILAAHSGISLSSGQIIILVKYENSKKWYTYRTRPKKRFVYLPWHFKDEKELQNFLIKNSAYNESGGT